MGKRLPESENERYARWDRNDERRIAANAHPFAEAWRTAVLDGDVARAEAAPRIRVVKRDFGNGHVECWGGKVWATPAKTYDRAIEGALPKPFDVPSADAERDTERNERRAKSNCRRYCKAGLVDSLHTLTYAENMQDIALARRHLQAFMRRMRAVLPTYRYVAVAERQERGAIHWHIATNGLPKTVTVRGVTVKSWNWARSVWRSITGDLGGNFDEAKAVKKWRKPGRIERAGSIGRYISKYLGKGFDESEAGAHRFTRSMDLELPRAERIEVAQDVTQAELIALVYGLVGDRVISGQYDPERGSIWVETDDSKPPNRGMSSATPRPIP